MRAFCVSVLLAGGLLVAPQSAAGDTGGGHEPTPAPLSSTIAAPAAPQAAAGTGTEPAATAASPSGEAKVEPPKPVLPSLIARINLATQTMTVQVHGKLVHTWKVSTGREGYPTPTGTFKPEWTARLWHSRKYEMAPMPHSVFFKSGAAIHATGATGLLGSPASHGCVRLAPANAETFYKLVGRHGLGMTRITVFGSPPVPRIARRDRPEDAGRGRSSAPRYEMRQARGLVHPGASYATSQFVYPGTQPYWTRY